MFKQEKSPVKCKRKSYLASKFPNFIRKFCITVPLGLECYLNQDSLQQGKS